MAASVHQASSATTSSRTGKKVGKASSSFQYGTSVVRTTSKVRSSTAVMLSLASGLAASMMGSPSSSTSPVSTISEMAS